MNLDPSSHPTPVSRAWYRARIEDFLRAPPESIVGRLAGNSDFALVTDQRDAWMAEIGLLQDQLAGLTGMIFMEFSIPRMGRRIDVVLLLSSIVFVVEFKVGEAHFDRAAVEQVWDYALDLKNFHQGSHHAPIMPVLFATGASESSQVKFQADPDLVYHPISVSASSFRPALDLALRSIQAQPLDLASWEGTPYLPTPTIIEAAKALYGRHSVDAITRRDAGRKNLAVTSGRIEELVDIARAECRKIICLVTGVPGAGKTLVGLNVATRRRDRNQPTHTVYLSGNGPLVRVLHEALTRDEFAWQKDQGASPRKGKIRESVKAFIQNVHHFRDDQLKDSRAPAEHVTIFDEAQRAWNVEKTAQFMLQKKKRPGFEQSEPEFLISSMDRHADWAVIVCLIGGGQEIHTGEAGIDAWIQAIRSKFPHWHMYISSRLTDSEYGAKTLEIVKAWGHTHFDDSLHLAVSMRSFRAEHVSYFVKMLLDRERSEAREALGKLTARYPIALTRDLRAAKEWIRERARGSERYGVVASSKAHRLKPDAIDIRVKVDPVHWFLDDKDDTRSSYYLEDAATEFDVQGLELDWACVAWDGDLRFQARGWGCHSFRGHGWCRINKPETQRNLCNAYRVLLTRARQGMVIYVPRGESVDQTRLPEFYDSTYQYLADLGIPQMG
jgi:hypothetical protein